MNIVGIDLGTTNSGVAIVKDGQPVMLPRGGERIMPSVVGYGGKGQWLVGTPARNQYVYDPENTVRSIKRSMGTAARVPLGGREFSPQEISAFILRELKAVAESNLGEDVNDVVITVPAYFSDAARQATRDAGQIAGFNVHRIINEPTAAALAYGLNMVEDHLTLVYDLGGGTFDVSLVELMDGIVDVRASHGNTHLGGDDFDELLANLLAEWFYDDHSIDLRQDRRAWARLMRAAETAKIGLTDQPFVWVREEYIAEQRGAPLHLEYEVSRQDLSELIEELVNLTLDSVNQVMADGDVVADEITQVLMVGGSSRVPLVWDTIANHLNIEPQMTLNPEEVVALGAGVQAAIIAGEPIDAILVDVTPHSLGIAIAENRMGRILTDQYKVLIRRNATIPTTKADVFSTLHPDQDAIRIEVFQGENPVASENTPLGNFLISDLEPEYSGQLSFVTVEFDMDVNGILNVTARDRNTGNEENITIEASSTRLTETEVLAAQNDLESYLPRHPSQPVDILPLDDEGQALVERAERLLDEESLKVSESKQLAELLVAIQVARAENAPEQLAELLESLLDLLFDLEE